MKRLREFALVAGLALWIWLVWRTGPALLVRSLERVGWGMFLLVAIAAVRHAVRSVPCRWSMGADRAGFSFREMYAILLVSEAIKFLVLAGAVLGESAKGILYAERLPAVRAVSSVVLDIVLYQLSAALFFLGGALWLVLNGPIDYRLRAMLWITIMILGAVSVVITLGFVRRWRSTRRWLAKFSRMRPDSSVWRRWFSKHAEKIAQAGEQVAGFYHLHTWHFYGILLFDLLAHGASACEVWTALLLLGQPARYGAALAIEALTKLVRISGAVVPANIGLFEGGTALILAGLGLPAAVGVALGLVRQLRSLLWAAAGLLVLPLWSGRPGPSRS